jgi:hypothetical protein
MQGHKGLQLYLHGSLASCDATAYSDVDTLLVISDKWFESEEAINELRHITARAQRWLYFQDPLQHHGFMIVTELDLGRYARSNFPLELMSHCCALAGAETIRYRVRESNDESMSQLRRLTSRIALRESGMLPDPSDRFSLKLALSELMLLPTYFLQATGRVMYKRESFAAVREALSSRGCEAMDALTDWRREWQPGPWEDAYRLFGERLPTALGRRLLVRARTAKVDHQQRDRWRRLLPLVRSASSELLQRAEAAA